MELLTGDPKWKKLLSVLVAIAVALMIALRSPGLNTALAISYYSYPWKLEHPDDVRVRYLMNEFPGVGQDVADWLDCVDGIEAALVSSAPMSSAYTRIVLMRATASKGPYSLLHGWNNPRSDNGHCVSIDKREITGRCDTVTEGRRVVESLVYINTARTPEQGVTPSDEEQWRAVALHESVHTTGLGHTATCGDSVMWESMNFLCENFYDYLTPDDIGVLEIMY